MLINLNNVQIKIGDMNNSKELLDIITVLECYKNDKMGESPPYTKAEKSRLISKLQNSKNLIVFLAYNKNRLAGGAVCFNTFSTFASKDIINIHDICVIEEFKSNGIGRRIMEEIILEAKRIDCCKITLEVREDNILAQNLYKSLGFNKSTPNMLFWSKPLSD